MRKRPDPNQVGRRVVRRRRRPFLEDEGEDEREAEIGCGPAPPDKVPPAVVACSAPKEDC